MKRELKVRRESWALASPFRISRGVKTVAEVIVVELRAEDGGRERCGRGESVPYARYGETVASVLEQIRGVAHELEAGLDPVQLAMRMPAGAARNAIDCALWDLDAKISGRSVHEKIGLGPLPALETAVTVSVDVPRRMGEAAARLAAMPLIKVKVDAQDPAAQLSAVHAAAPRSRLIVDANEGWDLPLLESMQASLLANAAVLLEQPLPAADDAALEGFAPRVPICADESCHTLEDLPRIARRYQAVNIKLDKAGGLTGARIDSFETRR